MLALLNDWISLHLLIWLLPVAFFLHDGEEIVTEACGGVGPPYLRGRSRCRSAEHSIGAAAPKRSCRYLPHLQASSYAYFQEASQIMDMSGRGYTTGRQKWNER